MADVTVTMAAEGAAVSSVSLVEKVGRNQLGPHDKLEFQKVAHQGMANSVQSTRIDFEAKFVLFLAEVAADDAKQRFVLMAKCRQRQQRLIAARFSGA